MRLSKLYSNTPGVLQPIVFRPGLNVVLAEIRLPENRTESTHNLGKTTLGILLDYCLLSEPTKRFFMYTNRALFDSFVFFLEVALFDGSFVTIRRAVAAPTKISFMLHREGLQDYSALPLASWTHPELAIDKAKEFLDGLLDARVLGRWSYRTALGYLIRAQEDFRDVFHLGKFPGAHSQWKPFLAHLLGFDAPSIERHYEKETELATKKGEEKIVERELGGSVADASKIEGLFLLRLDEVEKKQAVLDAFDFRRMDADKTVQLVDTVDEEILRLNARRYSVAKSRRKILDSLEKETVVFDAESAAALFAEVGVLFPGQLKRDFNQVIAFNKAITDERRQYLKGDLAEIDAELHAVQQRLETLAAERTSTLSFLTKDDVFTRYKKLSDELVTARADLINLERQRGFLHRLQQLRTEVRSVQDETTQLQTVIEKNVEDQNSEKLSHFSKIRVQFSEIIKSVISRRGLLSVSANKQGHLDFRAQILDEAGLPTSADEGFTYRKILCAAFDLSLAVVNMENNYPRFVFHDGIFESLDDRIKENLLVTIRSLSLRGVQQIVTLIDSDLPARSQETPVFHSDEIILRLHDEGESGRLFKMKAW